MILKILKKPFSFFSSLGKLWLEKSIGKLIIATVLLLIIQTIVIFVSFGNLPPKVPFYYSRSWGENQLTSSQNLFLLPIASFLILLINSFFSMFFLEKKKFVSICLIITTVIFSLFCLITLLEIINVII